MSASGDDHSRRGSAWLALCIIVAVTLAASVNRQLIGLVAQPVKVAFGLSDTQLGGLMSFSAILVAVASPVLGQMVDRLDRHRILLGSILVWSVATAAYGMAASYMGLAISLAILATAESALGPVCNSLIADRFHGGPRINANLIYFAAGGLTTGVGSYVGGLLLGLAGDNLPAIREWWHLAADWRVALALTALAGIPLALLTLSMGRETRKPSGLSVIDLTDLKRYIREHWQTLLSFNLSSAGFLMAATTVMGWMPIYIVRHFGIPPAALGMRIGMVIGAADVLGIVFGFLAIKRLYRHLGPIAPRYIFQFSLIPIAALIPLQLVMTTSGAVLIVLGMQNFLATFATASFNNMVQDMSPPDIRGKIFAINAVIGSVAGIPGPLLVGVVSDHFSQSPDGLLWSIILVSAPALLLSSVFFGLTNQFFLRTVSAMKDIEGASHRNNAKPAAP